MRFNLFFMLLCFATIYSCVNSDKIDQDQPQDGKHSTSETIAENTIKDEVMLAENKESSDSVASNQSSENVEEINVPPIEEVVKVKKPTRPEISFQKDVHDFGEITAGDIIDHKFNFKNTGNAPLVVKSTSVTCGCTIPSYPFIPIEPGESGYIGVTYNSVGKSGSQNPSITVITNASPAKYVLTMEGVVKEKSKVEIDTSKNGNQ